MENLLDAHNRALLAALERDARLSYSALAREVGLSQPAVAERVRRLEEAGVLTGYRALVARAAVGRPLTAFLRLSCAADRNQAVATLARELPEVVDCHHVTGEDCFFLKLAVDSLDTLERVVDRFRAHGRAIVEIALSTVVEGKPVDLAPATRREGGRSRA